MNTSPPEADGNQEVLGFSPAPCSIKGARLLPQARRLLGARAHRLLGLGALRRKSLFFAQQLVS